MRGRFYVGLALAAMATVIGLACASSLNSSVAAVERPSLATEKATDNTTLRPHDARGGEEGKPVNFNLSAQEAKTFAVNGVPQVKVGNFNGPVKVRAWDKPEVSVNIVKRAIDKKALDAVRLQGAQRGAQVAIDVKFTQPHRKVMFGRNEVFTAGAYVELEIVVPRNTNLRISNEDGPLSVEGVNGEVNLRTGDGGVAVSGGGGRLTAYTNDGLVSIANYTGEVDATEMGDHGITLEGRFAQLKALTGGGAISLQLPSNPNATIETDAEDVDSGALKVTGEGGRGSGVRRLKIGSGGNVFSLRTNSGKLVLRSAN